MKYMSIFLLWLEDCQVEAPVQWHTLTVPKSSPVRNYVILSLLTTFSFDNSILPAVWLISCKTPMFRKGNPADAKNYRHIALTSTMCNFMESVIKDQNYKSSFLLIKTATCRHQKPFHSFKLAGMPM